uniref:Uncharacterized protein n=1 Tax=Guillardia theta TaxID=55529 RepID=A0A7S4PN11_GUITH|mmetsp:Transcript_6486/g.23068  ORF Transcript_6486/g.23068 Transcript_6486/m.23068 type:complete len:253 (+) Transcript_6486:184-942(+)
MAHMRNAAQARNHSHADDNSLLQKASTIAREFAAYLAENCSPFDDPELEEKYRRSVLLSMFSLNNIGCVLTLILTVTYYIGVLLVRIFNKGINDSDDYFFLIRLVLVSILWVVLLLTPRMNENQRCALGKVLKGILYVRTMFFSAELLLADMHIERMKIVLIIMTMSFIVSSQSFNEYVQCTGYVTLASVLSRVAFRRNPMPWTREIESILFSIGLYAIGVVIFAILQANSHSRFLRYYTRMKMQKEDEKTK